MQRGQPWVAYSRNAGVTFHRSTHLALTAPEQIAVIPGGNVAVGNGGIDGSGRFAYRMLISSDAGRSWRIGINKRELVPSTTSMPGELEFTSPHMISWLASPTLAWASDDGRRWRRLLPP
jgi:hypothetical protein